MLYLATLSWRPEVTRDEMDGALKRRATYEFPKGFKHLAEYWASGPVVVTVAFEAESYAPIIEFTMDWQDAFDIAVYPATTAEEGLKLGAEALRRRKAA
jgi:hypothetical protein